MPGPASMSEAISGFDPRSIAGCQLWLDAIDTSAVTGSSPVTAWRDKSLNASNTTSVAGTNVLTQNAINGRQAIFLNGSSSFTGSTTGSGTTLTVCIVATQSSTCATNGGLVCFGRAGFDDWNDLGSLAITNFGSIGSGQMCSTRTANSQVVNTGVATPFIYVLVFDGTFVNSYLNGTIQTATNIPLTGTFAYTGYKIGTRAGATVNVFWTGFIGEVLVYNTGLTTTERQQIEGYLGWKWGIESTPILPSSISGLAMWLDGADPSTLFTDTGATTAVTADGNSIAAWRDKSTNAYLFTQATAGSRPTYKTSILNGRSITRFNGTSTFLQSSATLPFYTSSTSGGSFFVVFMATTVTTQRFLMTYQNQVTNTYCGTESELGYTTGNNGQGNFGMHQGCSRATIAASGTIVINSYVLMSYILGTTGTTPANSTIFKNGTSLTPSNDQTGFYSAGSYPSANNARFLNIGARVFNGSQATDCFHSGDIAELIWYRTPLSTTERLGVESYLYSKWNIPVPTQALPFTHPFSSIRPFSRYFNPIDIQGCVLWLDATDSSTITLSGVNMTQWNDKSGLANNMIPFSTFSNATVMSSYWNGLNVLNFSGAGVYQAPASSAVYPIDVYIVMALKDLTTHVDVISLTPSAAVDNFNNLGFSEYITSRWYNGSSSFARTPNTQSATNETSTSFLLMNWSIANNNFVIRRNGTQLSQTASYTWTMTAGSIFQLGWRISPLIFSPGSFAGAFRGYIGEIVAFNSQLTTSQRQVVEGYLASKWGLVSSLPATHPFSKFPPSSALPFSPTNLSGCAVWLDAADLSSITLSGSSVIQWNDKSGNNRNAVQLTPANRPVYSFSDISVDTTTNPAFLNMTSMPAAPYDIFVVGRPIASTTDFRTLFRTNTADPGMNPIVLESGSSRIGYFTSSAFAQFGSYTWAPSTRNLLFARMNASKTMSASLNGVAALTADTAAGTASDVILYMGALVLSGSAPGQQWGRINEVIFYTTPLSTAQRQLVEGYLASKWALQNSLPSTHPYRNFQPAQTSFLIITPGTIATVTLSALSGSGGTITWTTSTNAVSYKWYVGTTFPTALVSGTVGNVLTTAVSYAFLASTNYFAWVIPVSSTGTDGATTQSAAASYTAGVLITTVGAGSVSLGAGSQIVIECWGAGGGSMGQDNSLGAGAGGAFAITTIAQTAAFTLFYSIGAGGIGSQGSGGVGGQTWARVGTNAVPTTSSEGARAAGGNGSGVGFPNNSTQAANSVGQTIFIGGAGGSGGAENGGGGAATPNGNGNNGLAGSGTAGGAAGTGGGGGGGGGGFSLSGGDGISNVLGGGGGGGSYNNAGGMGGLPGGAGGMGWSTGNSAPSGFVNTNPHGFGGDGGRGQIRYTRT
jgi:hypothetical protein